MFEVIEDDPDRGVEVGDVGEVGVAPGVAGIVEVLVAVGGGDADVGRVVGEEEEERRALRSHAVEPADRVGADDVAGVALERAHGLAGHGEEVTGMLLGVHLELAGEVGVLLRDDAVREALLAGKGSGPARPGGGILPVRAVEVPLAEDARAVAAPGEQLGDRDLRTVEERLLVAREIVDVEVDRGAGGDPAGQESGAGGRADGRRRVVVGEDEALRGEAREVGGADVGVSEYGERFEAEVDVAVAEVVDEDDDDVGRGAAGGRVRIREREAGECCGEDGEAKKGHRRVRERPRRGSRGGR